MIALTPWHVLIMFKTRYSIYMCPFRLIQIHLVEMELKKVQQGAPPTAETLGFVAVGPPPSALALPAG